MNDTGSFFLVGLIHGTCTINMASISAFSDGALALAGNSILAAKAVADTHIIDRMD